MSDGFLKILNEQEPKIQFTAEYENEEKELNYLDVKILNNQSYKYEFKIHRKDAITNVQIKPESCHDDKIKNGVFKGFLLRANAICSEKYLADEIAFIKKIFIENAYDERILKTIVNETKKTKQRKKQPSENRYTSIPWVPGLSQKLRKAFKRTGCVVSFKSPRNLESILTSKNKPRMPANSQPGVYFVPTGCQSGYTGETKKQISSRNTEHEKAVFYGNTKDDAIAEHASSCDCEIDWEQTRTLAVEPVWFKRKIREALEIRRLKTGPDEAKGLNRDLGDYVTTNTWSMLLNKVNTVRSIQTFESMTSNDTNV